MGHLAGLWSELSAFSRDPGVLPGFVVFQVRVVPLSNAAESPWSLIDLLGEPRASNITLQLLGWALHQELLPADGAAGFGVNV